MVPSKFGKFILVGLIGIVGLTLLFHVPSPTPESVSRYSAIQSSYAPNRPINSEPFSKISETEEHSFVYGQPVSPKLIDISIVKSQTPVADEYQLAYESGDVELGFNEGPVSEAVFQTLIEESKQQRVDLSVQNFAGELQDSNSVLNKTTLSTDDLVNGVNFKAIDYTQSRHGVPPDPDIMVGKDHVVVGVNTSFQIFDKTGTSLHGPTLYEDFWGSYCGNGSDSLILFDPYSQYDEENGRYILGIAAYDPSINGGNNGWACIAVSQTDSARGNWWLYSFNGNPGDGTDYFFDYPHIGVGQDAIYLTANMFGSYFTRNHIFAFEKDAMYAGQAAKSLKFNLGSSHFSLQPAKLKGFLTGGWPADTNEPHYFVDAQWGNNQNELTVWQLTDPWQNPIFTQVGSVTVNNYSLPLNQPQLNGNNLQGNDNRLLDVENWGGKLWTTHTVGCNPGGGTVNCIRWYEIDIRNGTPSLMQQGTFSSDTEYRSFPDLGVNACGDLLIGYTKTSSNMYPGIFIAGREANDEIGLLKEERLVHAGEATYVAYDSVPHRWGDYTGMALDPDGITFWYVGQYSRQQETARWSTWVSSHTWKNCVPENFPDPPVPTATSTPNPELNNYIYIPSIFK